MTKQPKTIGSLVLMLLCAGSWWAACTEPAKQPGRRGSDSLVQTTGPAKSADMLPYRERLIQALQQLQKEVASKNKEAIAAHFRFPVQSNDLQAFDIGDAFDKAVKGNNYRVSQQLFLTHFDALYLNLEMQGLTDMFAHLKLSRLQDTAIKQIQAVKQEGVCMYSYNIVIEDKEVTLQYGVNTDEAYTSKHMDEDPECLEYAALWTFIFDGSHLVFARHQVAG